MFRTLFSTFLNGKYLTLLLVLGLLGANELYGQAPSIIPKPVSLTLGTGDFILDQSVSLHFDQNMDVLNPVVIFLNSYLRRITGDSLAYNTHSDKSITLTLGQYPEIGTEGYLMNIEINSLSISANTKNGLIYGLQTLFQLLPAIRTNAIIKIPAMVVKDYPRFSWRGMHLDVSRHFYSPDLVKLYIDLLAKYKFNIFHWHLVDDQGWRIEIKQYPGLTGVGAWRVDKNNISWSNRPQAKPGEPATYGGYYTQDQIRDIVEYAAKRNITIVPEIEMPAHVASAIAAYPWLSCSQRPQLPMTGGDYSGIASGYCAGNDRVFTFLENVLTEVMALFPSKYIHIGGDELDKGPWKSCPKCQARIKKEGLKNVDELQSYFIKRMEKFLNSKGRKIIGWDEILEGGLAPDATVMSWRGEAGGIAAAQMGHDVIMSPGTPLYFNHYQADPATEPEANGGFNTLKMVYEYDPIPELLNPEQGKHILGAQANIWGEYILTPMHVLYMMLPRMLALSEVDWTPKKEKDWVDFNERLQVHYSRLDAMGLPYSKGNMKVKIQPETRDNHLYATLSTEAYKGEVYYTTDGSKPDINHLRYTGPIRIDHTQTIRAVTVINGAVSSKSPSEQSFVLHKAVGRTIKYIYPNSPYYKAEGPNTLIDGIRGTTEFGDKWHGFTDQNLIAVVDLGSMTQVHKISLGCLQQYRDWIMMPTEVTFEISKDGQHFTKIKSMKNKISENDKEPVIFDFAVDFPVMDLRYVRVTAKVLEHLPEGHSGAGKRAWVFADELMVE